ncbi:putative lipoprotein [Plesiocystis pacifica SIR-1]|uniref:Putative lipoprotein n=1 Tax=Plesiocystis pacifica SIR-1 TaxID=391625 RepID=A6FY14_9BACT|nr:fibrinogen-like YCDxxxxGGGW domain-containing protein [Plesiocystis pacifica]EDM81393.1 putative lipoprotein [Plesiocystis pacifica SIR-1]
MDWRRLSPSLCLLVGLTACPSSETDEGSTTFSDVGNTDADTTTGDDEVGTETESGETGETTETGTEETTTEESTETSVGECGDGQVDGNEECDNGAENAEDAECTPECTLATCGDGYVYTADEECDDAGESATCDADCTAVMCGDGVVNAAAGEACDDEVESATCNADCSASTCGDGILNVTAGEECDDANDDNTDDCVMGCLGATCGDGYLWEGNEVCDDGNTDETDGCLSICVAALPSCQAWLDAVPDSTSGPYTIDPDGDGGVDPFEVFCDMETDGGGWTLILNRVVDSDNTGQPDLDATLGTPDALRQTNWQFDIGLFWTDATEVAFADKENASCEDCTIGDYDAAIKVPRPNAAAWSKSCVGTSASVTGTKLVGTPGNTNTFQCAASLGWGNCSGNVCHYGTHNTNTASNGAWSQNQWNEMHFPSTYSSYASYGNYANPPSAWCRSCGGGLPEVLNSSATCCGNTNNNARSRWTIWVR